MNVWTRTNSAGTLESITVPLPLMFLYKYLILMCGGPEDSLNNFDAASEFQISHLAFYRPLTQWGNLKGNYNSTLTTVAIQGW